ncbi:MAG TPA: spondin domain-containing protein [Gammaproteobacteria bacterium]|nr:spondin domain-containing protein [Gammaproteobacteria bacterium]
MLNRVKPTGGLALAALLLFTASQAVASGEPGYHVTITNLTHSITFTPILVASHRRPLSVFDLGAAASDDLRAIAEAGNIAPMAARLSDDSQVIDVQDSGGLLKPGESVTVVVSGARGARFISAASMMLPTNDGFIGLDSAEVAKRGSVTLYSPGYDAGSEVNDELCANIPGPTCGGAGPSPGDDPVEEGYVQIHRGTQGIGNLSAATYDWRNPVARITITRVRGNDDD